MIVGNDMESLEILQGLVSGFLGYECLAVSSAREAFDRMEEFNPQLIITDYSMVELNGTDFTGLLKIRVPHIATIVLSADKRLSVAIEAMRNGAEDFLIKPASVDDLETAIQRVQKKWDGAPSAAEAERLHIESVLAHTATLAEAAEKLGLNTSTIWRKSKIKKAA